MTLSDVHAAHAVLAEKANQHWVKGLGGGQNKESETIVQFLYKRKVGNGKSSLLTADKRQTSPRVQRSNGPAARLNHPSCCIIRLALYKLAVVQSHA